MTTATISTDNIKRHGRTILLGDGLTATEGYDGNLPALTIRRNGKRVKSYRGSSLGFSRRLTDEDKQFLVSLADGC